MIKSLSTFITQCLERNNNSLTGKDILKIQYTLEVILGDLTKFIILLLIFLSLNEIPLFLLCFTLLISTRPVGGGIHCKTFYSCLIFTILYFIVILLFSNLSPKLNINFYIIFFIISFGVTLFFAPCRNEKRPVKNKVILKILSLISLTFWTIIFFNLSNIQVSNCIFISILLQIIQLTIVTMKGVVFNGKINKSFFSHTY
ncbi:accessory gene regulator B family protein [Clostridium sp. C2-6-12]|uniref:accessory gene regulator B family protein n=1 Tax=Clostridium sp. C2-6-12 TaxID=2698832 RepID=UPI00136F4B44|nr:accessory gene regulator B family protein [Clostridium sp. C2-6-12]